MLTTLAAALLFGPLDSPFIVPVAGCAMILGIVVAGIWSGVRTREMQSAERMAAIAQGLPLPPLPEESPVRQHPQDILTANRRRRGNVRRGGLICVGVGLGLIAFFIALAAVLQTRAVLAGATVGLIPLGIGVALLVDAGLQTREIDTKAADSDAAGSGYTSRAL